MVEQAIVGGKAYCGLLDDHGLNVMVTDSQSIASGCWWRRGLTADIDATHMWWVCGAIGESTLIPRNRDAIRDASSFNMGITISNIYLGTWSNSYQIIRVYMSSERSEQFRTSELSRFPS